jgi:protein SCO1/2
MTDTPAAPPESAADAKWFLAFGVVVLLGFAAVLAILFEEPPLEGSADQPVYRSLALTNFALTERSGRLVTRDELRGQIVVVGFVFTSCGVDCRVSAGTMAGIQDVLGNRDDVRLVSLTVDPRSDNTEVLRKFAGEFGADPEHWLFLTGEPDAVFRTLKTSFLAPDESEGLMPAALPAGRLPLVSRLYLLDRDGHVREAYDARTPDTPARVMAAVEELTAEQPAVAAHFTSTRTYATKGVIRKLADDRQTAIIRHEEIPGYMPAMTMRLNVHDTNELRNLVAGDVVTFKLTADADTHWIHDLARVGSAGTGATPELRAFEPPSVPAAEAEAVFPDFEFRAETDLPVKLSDYRGKALAFTFIFTRCPLPDYCPRMGNRFAGARKLLKKEGGPQNWQLLSISFDSEYDRPEVLKSYGDHYRAGDPDRWLFAVASPATLAKLAPLCDLQFMAEGGSFTHNLRTVVLTPKGAIHRVFAGNLFTAAELAAAIQEAAGL